MISAYAGFVAGAVHVLSGPDHLAAVAPFAAHGRERAWMTGLRWGLGHASGVSLVGLLALLFRRMIPMEWVSSWSERLVGLVLIGIGIWGIRIALARQLHAHEHGHEGLRHVHFHLHNPRVSHPEPHAHHHTHAPFAVGILHGLAGSSHLLGVLPALALPSHGAALAYLAGFGIGTIAAMSAFSSTVGLVSSRFAVGATKAYRGLLFGFSACAIVLGVAWLVR